MIINSGGSMDKKAIVSVIVGVLFILAAFVITISM